MTFDGGIYPRLTFKEYRAIDRALNYSALKEMRVSPLEYRHCLENPKEETTPLRLGSAAHTAVLEPERFLTDYALWDERKEDGSGDFAIRRGKKWDAFVEANAGKSILRADEFAAALAIRDAVRSRPAAMKYLRKGAPEVSMVWPEATTGRACKGRIDWLSAGLGNDDVLVGLKTSRDIRPVQFGNQAAKLGYHLQWAFYHDGYLALTGRRPKLKEIVVRNNGAADVVVFNVPEEVIDAGREEYIPLVERVLACEASGEWPGVEEGEVDVTLPSWVYKRDEDLSDLGLELEVA